MEEVVEAFMRAREAAMEVAQLKAKEEAGVVQGGQGGQKRKRSKGERSESTEPRKTRTSSRISSRTTPQASYEAMDMTEEKDEGYTPGMRCPSTKSRSNCNQLS